MTRQKAEPASTPTSARTKWSKMGRKSAGFSLIEILIVVAIIGMVTFMVLPGISGYFQLSLHTASREMAAVIKEAYNSTIMSGKVHRIVYDFKENAYWVESGPPTALLDTQDTLKEEERRKRFRKSEEQPKGPAFTLERYVNRKKKSLPRGVEFEDILTQQRPDPLIEGTAYTHIFPHGLTEQTVIHLKDTSNHHSTLVIAPLIGTTDVYERYMSREDLAQAAQNK